MKASVITFPGSNCDKDVGSVLEEFYGIKVSYVWHKESIEKTDLVVLPGGFSYGDYLRCGAMARFSPAMESVIQFAKDGGKVLGICNGFQILTEAGLLPGALTNNISLQYICSDSALEAVEHDSGFWNQKPVSSIPKVFNWPIAHGEGRFHADDSTLKSLEEEGNILIRYKVNPNGSKNGIAGITSSNKRIVGMMPHPERAMNPFTNSMDGKLFFDKFLAI
jgi:phosphoribosylformylglycinamidine synthase subunit PurQ / glutaminase